LHYFVNIALLVTGYKISYQVRPREAALLGLGAGILMALNQWLWMSVHGIRLVHVAAIALAQAAVLVPSYALCARRDGLLVAVLNLAVGGAAAMILPFAVVGWIGG
jgi:hypothetical protein